MEHFQPFDPLKARATADTEVAALAQKREIRNILSSYVGWWDPFSELIQNALDSVEEQSKKGVADYEPTIWITIDIRTNSLVVTDNGTGLDKERFEKFLSPDISFKSGTGKTRGHKGVGATYLAYGFNYIQVATKTGTFLAVGLMENARTWLDDESPAGNPQVRPDSEPAKDDAFKNVPSGVSVFIKFDKDTHPRDLKWIVAEKAEEWLKILSVKTGLGAFHPNDQIRVHLKVIDRVGAETHVEQKGVNYFWTELAVTKSASITEINKKENELFAKVGRGYKLPAALRDLDAFYQKYSAEDVANLESQGVKFSSDDKEVIKRYDPEIYVSYVYSVKVWDAINGKLNVRAGQRILYGGIQLAANNMPQGETVQIPLVRYIGRQNQIHFVFHFNNCSSDLGRKGFQAEVLDFAKETARKIADGILNKITYTLRANTGMAPNLQRQTQVETWKREMENYEKENSLSLISEHFFLPLRKISITSNPTREQDVIALFNQLIAGGVIRGVRLMSTNERLTYDGLYRAVIEEPTEHHLYEATTNPLGIDASHLDGDATFLSHPRIVEYKFSLDGLIEDIGNGDKNSNDIELVVVWETGAAYEANYQITSLLDPDNLAHREYHGVTHLITNLNTGQHEMNLIVLSELIDFLNNPEDTIRAQIEKYEA